MTELRKEISSVFNMTRFLCNSLEHSLEKAFTLEEIHKFKRVVMTGCGDSLCASMAAKECFEELTGRMVDVPTCIDLTMMRAASANPAKPSWFSSASPERSPVLWKPHSAPGASVPSPLE